jgi:ribosomal protein L32
MAGLTMSASLTRIRISPLESLFHHFSLKDATGAVPLWRPLLSAVPSLASLLEGWLFAVPKKKVTRRTIKLRHKTLVPKNREDFIRCQGCGNTIVLHAVCTHCFARYKNLVRLCKASGLKDFPEVVERAIKAYPSTLPKMRVEILPPKWTTDGTHKYK